MRSDLTSILQFLDRIGIAAKRDDTKRDSFLEGVRIVDGGLVFDPSLRWPGDLLHEAGHIAMAPATQRPSLNDTLDTGDEVAAIAWSYAAIVAIGLDPSVLFHRDGYRGQSPALLFSFTHGVYPGVHGLVQAGMTVAGEYPRMIRWLRD